MILAIACVGAVLAPLRAAQTPLALETFDAVWQIVRDSHFDETFNGVAWDAVASELRPRAAAAATPGQLRAVLREMLGHLRQSHFSIIPATADRSTGAAADLGGSPGLDVRLIGRQLVVTRVDPGGGAADAGVRTGWLVLALDETPATSLLELLEPLEPRLLQVEAWRLAQTHLRGPAGTSVRITFEDGSGRTLPLRLERRPESGSPATVGNLPTMFVRVETGRADTPRGRAVGVIRFNVWMPAVDALVQKAIDEHRSDHGIVIDLRGNPGGLAAMLMGISGHFIDERLALGVMKTRDSELRFVVNPRRVNARGERVTPFGGPVAILIDGLSGSASECFTGGMQSLGRVRVFGEVSMGQALPALFSRLPNGDVLIHAYGDFVTSDGTRLEGRGVVPDEAIAPSRGDLLAGRDPVMEAALLWMDTVAGSEAAPLLQ